MKNVISLQYAGNVSLESLQLKFLNIAPLRYENSASWYDHLYKYNLCKMALIKLIMMTYKH